MFSRIFRSISTCSSTLSGVVGVEESDDEVDEEGKFKGDCSPQTHPSGEPVQHWHTCTNTYMLSLNTLLGFYMLSKSRIDVSTWLTRMKPLQITLSVCTHSSASSATPFLHAGRMFARRNVWLWIPARPAQWCWTPWSLTPLSETHRWDERETQSAPCCGHREQSGHRQIRSLDNVFYTDDKSSILSKM